MTATSGDGPWANYDAAMAAVRKMHDPSLQQFVMRAVTATSARLLKGAAPVAPFDLLFFVETMAALFDQRESLQRVLAGEDLRGWPDEET
jgi:hypothetical protein